MAKIFVYTVPRETATGLSKFTNESSGKSLKKTKMGNATTTIRALYSPKIGGLANYISYTPWIGEDGLPKLSDTGKPLMLQDKMEEKWNLPKGYLTNFVPTAHSIKADDVTYYQSKRWKMKDGCTVFDTSNMDEELGYYVLLASSICANSEREYLEHKWPRAQFYIAIENESEELQYSRNEIKSKAFSYLHSPDFTDVYKRKFVSLLDLATTKSVLTPQQVHNLLYKFIDQTGYTPTANVYKFNGLYQLLSTADGREQLEARYILAQAIDTRVVTERQDVYVWNRARGPITIGERYDEAIDFILNPKKAPEVEEMREEIAKRS